jgi:chitodextrinase
VFTSAFSASRFTLRPDRADFTTASPDGTASGKLVDQGSVPCQGRGPDTMAPTAPTVRATSRLSQNLAVADLTWSGATDDRGVASYDVLRDGTVVAQDLPGTSTAWSDETVRTGTTYTYRVRAKDVWGNATTSSSVSVTTPVASSTPTVAPLLADTYVASASPTPKGSADRIRVLANGTSTDVAYLKFDLSRISGTIASATLRLTPAAGTKATATAYSVADTSWSESTLGWPGPPVGTAGGRTSSPLVADTPNDVDVTGLVTAGTVSALALKETSGTSTQAYYSKEAGGSSAPQLLVTVQVPPDTRAPTAPTSVRATADTETEVDLSWSASSDDRAVDHYLVHRDSRLYDRVPATALGYVDVGVAAGQRHSYAVSAVDPAGNESALSAAATVTVPDLTSPVEVEPPVVVATSSTSASVSWQEAEDNVAVTGYRVYRNGTVVAQVAGTAESWNDTTLQPSTSYTYGLQAVDAAGNASAVRTAPPVTTPAGGSDTTPPTTPTGLTATGVSGSSVRLTWQASTDDVGVDAYTVFRDGSPIARTSSRELLDTSLSPAQSYGYAVDAVDAAGNHSMRPAEVRVTTPDDVPPSAPTGLTVSADSYRSVTLAWTASSDNVGTIAYVVSRNGTTVGQSTTTSYADTTAPADADVTYQVRARDAAGNLSPATSARFHTPAPRTVDSGWVEVTDSAYVQSGTSSASNYRYATVLKVAGGTTPKVTYLKLTVPAGVLPVLDHLYLQLTTTTTSPGFSVRRVAVDTWNRSTLTWDNKPAWDAGVLATSGQVTQTGTVPNPPGVIDLASMITGPGTYSVALTADASTGQSYSSTYSSVPVAERPKVRWISHD